MGTNTEKRTEREQYLILLRETAERLGRLPQKADFSNKDMSRMKAYWGPWPHVLAAAELIPSKQEQKTEKKKMRKERLRAEKQSLRVEDGITDKEDV